jgi:hypothetical protein
MWLSKATVHFETLNSMLSFLLGLPGQLNDIITNILIAKEIETKESQINDSGEG